MAHSHILVADDDAVVSGVVRRYLEHAGLRVTNCADGRAALAAVQAGGIDLAVLDVLMPQLDGIETCRRIRAGAQRDTPIILLTALGSEEDRIAGLEVGADDYVTKPFSPRELALRIAGVLRRVGSTPDFGGDLLTDGPIELRTAAREVRVGDIPIALTSREFDLLRFFLANPDEVFDRDALLERVWGWSFGDHSTVTVHIRRLRGKLGAAHRIQTVWGHGYRWGPDEASGENR